MLKVKCDHGDMEVTMKGDLSEICADVLTIINTVYNGILEDSILDGAMFKHVITTELKNALVEQNKDISEMEDLEDE